MLATKGAKSNGPVSVTVPGVVMASILAVTDVSSEVVSEFSESWNWAAITAIEPSMRND